MALGPLSLALLGGLKWLSRKNCRQCTPKHGGVHRAPEVSPSYWLG